MVDDGPASIVELAKRATAVGDPAASLAALAALRRRIEDLEEFQVENALRYGWSWEQIGAAAGRTKQAMHKRYGRLNKGTPRGRRMVVSAEARRAVELARIEAGRFGDGALASHHLLLGLVAAGAGPPGVTLASARQVVADLPRTSRQRKGLTPSARAALERSLSECVVAGDDVLRPEHILRALLRQRRIAALAAAGEPIGS
jgi:hypothetical protein